MYWGLVFVGASMLLSAVLLALLPNTARARTI
jgi:hypothetical protein